MTQAILYGSYSEVCLKTSCGDHHTLTLPQNPLHFSFPPEIDEESLMSGATLLSNAILESGKRLLLQHLVQRRPIQHRSCSHQTKQ
jgi:nuclear pore complex protein Nup133